MKSTPQYLSNAVSVDAKTELYGKLLTSLILPKNIYCLICQILGMFHDRKKYLFLLTSNKLLFGIYR